MPSTNSHRNTHTNKKVIYEPGQDKSSSALQLAAECHQDIKEAWALAKQVVDPCVASCPDGAFHVLLEEAGKA